MTYPLIGNYGRLLDDDQSARPWLSALVVANATAAVLDDARQLAALLRGDGIPAIAGVDTRALARHLRSTGCLRGIVTAPGQVDRETAVEAARSVPRWEDQDFVARVSPAAVTEVGEPADGGPLVAILDFGSKANIVRSLRRRGARVRVLPHTAAAAEALAPEIDGLVLSPGPGDPARLDGLVALARAAIDDGRPLLGICLGHQIVGRAAGADTPAPPVRPPRGEPPGPRRRHGPRPGDRAEPRGPGRGRLAAARQRLPGQPGQPQRPVRRGPAPHARSRSRRSSTTQRARPGRSTRSPSSTGSWPRRGGGEGGPRAGGHVGRVSTARVFTEGLRADHWPAREPFQGRRRPVWGPARARARSSHPSADPRRAANDAR